MQTLTNGQKQALLEAQNGHNIFISGGGGVGKSYPMRRKTPCFSYGDIRRVHRIYASN